MEQNGRADGEIDTHTQVYTHFDWMRQRKREQKNRHKEEPIQIQMR